MVDFPSTIAKPSIYNFGETRTRPVLRTESESGWEVTRARAFKARTTWSMSWIKMSTIDKEALDLFYSTYTGTIFNWTHPLTNVVYSVRFVNDSLSFEYNGLERWSANVTIKEV